MTQSGTIQSRVEAYWSGGDESLLTSIEVDVKAARVAEKQEQITDAKAQVAKFMGLVVAAEEAIITGDLSEVGAQQARLELLSQRAEQAEARVRQLLAQEEESDRLERRYALGVWPDAEAILAEPWQAAPDAAVALCALREEVQGLQVAEVAESAFLRPTGAELIVTQVTMPRLEVLGEPIENWRRTNALIEYRRGELQSYRQTRLLLRGQSIRPHTILAERVVAVLACRSEVAKGDQTYTLVHDFRPAQVQERERVFA